MPKRISKSLKKNPDRPIASPPPEVLDAVKKTVRRKRDSRQKKQMADPYRPSELAFLCYMEFCKGRSQYDIAEEIGVKRDAVYAYIRRVREYLADQMMDEINGLRKEHADRLSHIAEEAMAAWERSKRDAVSESTSSGGKEGDKTTKTRTGQVGNVAYLTECRAALKEHRDLMGVKPILAPEDNGGGDLRIAGRDKNEVLAGAVQRLQQRMQMTSVN